MKRRRRHLEPVPEPAPEDDDPLDVTELARRWGQLDQRRHNDDDDRNSSS